MKHIINFLTAVMVTFALLSCENDGERITLSGHEPSELMATTDEVVLSQRMSDSVVLTLSWTKSSLTLSRSDMSVPANLLKITLQVSSAEDFSTTLVESEETSLSKAYTGSELNALAASLGLPSGEANALYFRIKSSVGDNMEPLFSSVERVLVTPYHIDFTRGLILNASQQETGVILYSPLEDGIYTGFMGVTAWYNFYLKEGDGTVWGNDGVTGTPFLLSSENDAALRWNCWFPGVGGCYYVTVNTVKKQWEALLLPSLSVSGDVQGDMTYDKSTNRWTLPFEATARSYTVRLNTTAKKYDYTTGTDDNAAISTPFGFKPKSGGAANELAISSTAEALSVAVSEAGTYTLIVDLSNPAKWELSVQKGSSQPVTINPLVYLAGIDDGITGSWNFNNTLKLYNEETLAYAGVVQVNSLWGYAVYTENGNWEDKYTFGEGDANAGTLVYKGTINLPAPSPGLYLIDVSLKNLSYQLTPVGSTIYVSGLNDVWDFNVTLSATGTVGEYAGSVTISQVSPWGFQIHLDNSWQHYFGGSNGTLTFKGANLKDDATLGPGVYTLTVNLIQGTYAFSK